jgi:hypothetical protein
VDTTWCQEQQLAVCCWLKIRTPHAFGSVSAAIDFQTYDNLDLRNLDFVGGKMKFIPMMGDAQSIKDVTDAA